MSDETDRIQKVLEANKDKDFVKRILDPDNSPSIDLGKGYTGTHLMAADWDDENQRWMVYPTIVRIEGQLEKLEVNEAMHHAKATGEYIDFADRKEEAISFSKNYKKVWETKEPAE
jgi:hypothetical protein